jgi:hypothetical protein
MGPPPARADRPPLKRIDQATIDKPRLNAFALLSERQAKLVFSLNERN